MNSLAKIGGNVQTYFQSRTWTVSVLRMVLALLVATTSMAQEAPSAPAFSISGAVRSGRTPIPGATVTATNASSGEKSTTFTDIGGVYTIQEAAAGKYELRVEMPGFAPSTREIVLDSPSGLADLELTLLSHPGPAEALRWRLEPRCGAIPACRKTSGRCRCSLPAVTRPRHTRERRAIVRRAQREEHGGGWHRPGGQASDSA